MEYYHLDTNNVLNTFGIIIKNRLENDNGANYVLERMLQLGCNKYKVRDAIQ